MILQVETRAGPHGDREPLAFFLGRQRLAVLRIIDRWLAPDYGYFKVEASDGSIYILRCGNHAGNWELTLFQAPAG